MKRQWKILITLGILTLPFVLGLLITYEKVPYDWISMMEIQPNFRAMEDPLPLPEDSVPVQGEVYIRGMGAPENPVEPSEESLSTGEALYLVHCAVCHGADGKGQGSVSGFLREHPPTDLTANPLVMDNAGAVYLTITEGVEGRMPALHQNLTVIERWHVVNYVQNLAE